MPKFDDIFGFRFNWTFNPFRGSAKSSGKSEQETSGDSADSEPNQRKASEQDESNYKRVSKYNSPIEPFRETLRILDELF